MASSAQLSTIHSGMNMAGMANSAFHDERLFNIVARVGRDMEAKYGINIDHESRVYAREICEGDTNQFEFTKGSHIRPDGGVLLVTVNGKRRPILTVENKQQGYDATKGGGNAIERLGKPAMVFEQWMANEAINPFLAFVFGTDFRAGSTTNNILGWLTRGGKLNQINLLKKGGIGGQSIFTSPRVKKPFTAAETERIVRDISERALAYYLTRYGTKALQASA